MESLSSDKQYLKLLEQVERFLELEHTRQDESIVLYDNVWFLTRSHEESMNDLKKKVWKVLKDQEVLLKLKRSEQILFFILINKNIHYSESHSFDEAHFISDELRTLVRKNILSYDH